MNPTEFFAKHPFSLSEDDIDNGNLGDLEQLAHEWYESKLSADEGNELANRIGGTLYGIESDIIHSIMSSQGFPWSGEFFRRVAVTTELYALDRLKQESLSEGFSVPGYDISIATGMTQLVDVIENRFEEWMLDFSLSFTSSVSLDDDLPRTQMVKLLDCLHRYQTFFSSAKWSEGARYLFAAASDYRGVYQDDGNKVCLRSPRTPAEFSEAVRELEELTSYVRIISVPHALRRGLTHVDEPQWLGLITAPKFI